MRILISFLLGTALCVISTTASAATPQAVPLEAQRIQQTTTIIPNPMLTQYKGSCIPVCRAKPVRHHHTPHRIHHSHHAVQRGPVFYPGSLKADVTRIAAQFGWKHVVWQPDYDYTWVGTTPMHAKSLADLLRQVFCNYPLQAIFYSGNHVLVIAPRNVK